MSDFTDQNIGFRQGVQYVMEELDGSFKHQDLTSLVRATAPGDMKGSLPARTHINRSMIAVDELKVVTAYEDNKVIKQYMSNPNSRTFDEMTADRHYAEAVYSSTVATPKVFKDRACFNSWDELRNGFNVNNDKLKAVVANITVAKNQALINAIKAPTVKRTTRDDDAEPSYADIALPSSQIYTLDSSATTLTYRDMLMIRARCKRMTGFNTYMFMSWAQQAEFKAENVQDLQNKDFVTSSDLRRLDESIHFQGITPVIVEDQFDAADRKVFGLDESEILLFNALAVTEVKWTDESLHGIDTQADMQAHFLRKLRADYVRTSDKGVMIIKIPKLAPTLTVDQSTLSLVKLGTAKEVAVTVNTNRVMPQDWSVWSGADWIDVKTLSGTGSGTIAIGATENTTGASRTGSVTVKSNGLTSVITVTQAGS